MKKYFFMFFLFVGMSSLTAFAQYKPTEKDLGKDCATENGKLGTWKQVTVTETSTGTNTRANSNSGTNTGTVSVSTSAKAGTKTTGVEVGAGASYQNSSTNSSTNTNSQSSTTTRSYQDIQCIEDKNANNPQMTPVRW